MFCFCFVGHLTKFGIPSLELRRMHLDLSYCYKIVLGLITLNVADFFSSFLSLQARRGHAYKLYKSGMECQSIVSGL